MDLASFRAAHKMLCRSRMTTRKVTKKKMSMPREKPATRKELHSSRAEVRRDFKKSDERWKKNDERWKKNDEQWKKNDEQWKKNDEQWKKSEERFAKAEARTDQIATGLENLIRSLPDEIDRRIMANNVIVFAEFEAIGARLLKAQQESFRSQFGALDDKYRDFPEWVATFGGSRRDHALSCAARAA